MLYPFVHRWTPRLLQLLAFVQGVHQRTWEHRHLINTLISDSMGKCWVVFLWLFWLTFYRLHSIEGIVHVVFINVFHFPMSLLIRYHDSLLCSYSLQIETFPPRGRRETHKTRWTNEACKAQEAGEWCWTDGSSIQSTGHSCKRPGFRSQHPHSCSHCL